MLFLIVCNQSFSSIELQLLKLSLAAASSSSYISKVCRDDLAIVLIQPSVLTSEGGLIFIAVCYVQTLHLSSQYYDVENQVLHGCKNLGGAKTGHCNLPPKCQQQYAASIFKIVPASPNCRFFPLLAL